MSTPVTSTAPSTVTTGTPCTATANGASSAVVTVITSGISMSTPVTSTAPSIVTVAIPTTSTANASLSVLTTTGGIVATLTSRGSST